jgi:hypothetical protein
MRWSFAELDDDKKGKKGRSSNLKDLDSKRGLNSKSKSKPLEELKYEDDYEEF